MGNRKRKEKEKRRKRGGMGEMRRARETQGLRWLGGLKGEGRDIGVQCATGWTFIELVDTSSKSVHRCGISFPPRSRNTIMRTHTHMRARATAHLNMPKAFPIYSFIRTLS